MSAALKAEDILARLAGDSDDRVAAWAARVDQRASRRQVDRDREVSRLLDPFIRAGLVERLSTGGYVVTGGDVFSLAVAA